MEHRSIALRNPHLLPDEEDVLYHFGLSKTSGDLRNVFGDVKFVCTGGSVNRVQRIALEMASMLNISDGSESINLSNSDRYCLYKAGSVLCASHGMGVPSLSIMMVEMIKLLHHANCSNVTFFRIGTSGGLGLTPGTVVVSNGTLNGELQPFHTQYILGQCIKRSAQLDPDLSDRLIQIGNSLSFPVATGKTMCADDFYEGQGRLDGAFCEYSAADKMAFIQKLFDLGVRNIEMEAVGFASMTDRANIKSGIVCVAIVNRFDGDQVNLEKDKIKEFELRPIQLVAAYIKHQMQPC